MRTVLTQAFPSLIRFERKKLPFEQHALIFGLLMAGIYFAFATLVLKEGAPASAYLAVRKLIMLYCAFLLMLELSPDSHNIYKKSIGLIAFALIFTDKTSALSSLYFLLATRLLTKSSGYLTTMAELVGITLFTAFLFMGSSFSYPLLLAAALLLDYRFKHKDNRNIPFIVLNLAISLLWFKNPFGIMTRQLDLFGGLAVFAVSILYILRLSILKNILSMNDIGNNLISPRRIKAAGILMVLSMILLAIGHGSLYQYLHLWVMLLCISLPYFKDIKKLFLQREE